MNIRTLTLLLLSFILSSAITAQHQNVMISNSNSPEEPSIYIDPNNTDRMVAGANIYNVFTSEDGGLTWNVGLLYSATNGVWGDPVTIVDNDGNFLYFHLSNPPAGNWIDRIVCQKSTDGGLTWNDGSYMGLNGDKAQDKHWVVIDRENENIYSTWTQFDDYGSSNPNDRSNILFSKSTDGGDSWSPALRINEIDGDCIDSDNTTEGAVPAVGPNGEIYVSWAGPEGIVFDRSLDYGETWLENDIFVSDFPGGWDYDIPGINRCNGLPITVCDLSGGENHGTIYINWSDQRNGVDDTDVWLVKSTDGGDTWSVPLRVNDDGDGIGPGKQQFFTWMAIDQVTGYLHFVFYDRRAYDDNNTDVYMAFTKDGGQTFTNYKVSEEPFLPNGNVFFGDYNNLSAHDNVVRPIWTRLQNGNLSVWTAMIDPLITEVSEMPQQEGIPFALEQNYPNPFSESTYFSFKLRKTSVVTLTIADMYGSEITRLINNEKMIAGKYFEHFNASDYDLPSGVYYFSLIGNNVNQVRKMVIER